MRALLLTLALGTAGAALLPSHQALAWWDRFGRWHGDFRRPVVVVAPPPVLVPVYPRPVYAGRYAHWVRPHYDQFGRFVRGHWA